MHCLVGVYLHAKFQRNHPGDSRLIVMGTHLTPLLSAFCTCSGVDHMHRKYPMFGRMYATALQKIPQVNRPSGCRDMGLLKSPLQKNTLNTLGFSRGTYHDRHLYALRVVNYGVEGMGLPNKKKTAWFNRPNRC